MGTASENRLQWLAHLVHTHGGMAALNRALGRSERDATLSQILNEAPNSKTGAPRKMGDKLARSIESALGLEHGVMDRERAAQAEAPPADAQLTDLERAALVALRGLTRDQQREAISAMERTRDTNLRIVTELAGSDAQTPPQRRVQPGLRPYPESTAAEAPPASPTRQKRAH